MTYDDATITCIIVCNSWETMRQAEQVAIRASALDNIFADVAIAFPNGIKEQTTRHYRLGDYFKRVQVLPDDSSGSTSFMLVFEPRQGAGRYWKDLMVRILASVQESVAGVFVESIKTSA